MSPIKDAQGIVVGASKIARDITERRRAQEQQRLLFREINHRVKNLFTLAGSMVTLSTRFAATPKDLAEAVNERLVALARAHDLTLPDLTERRKKDPIGRRLCRLWSEPFFRPTSPKIMPRSS